MSISSFLIYIYIFLYTVYMYMYIYWRNYFCIYWYMRVHICMGRMPLNVCVCVGDDLPYQILTGAQWRWVDSPIYSHDSPIVEKSWTSIPRERHPSHHGLFACLSFALHTATWTVRIVPQCVTMDFCDPNRQVLSRDHRAAKVKFGWVTKKTNAMESLNPKVIEPFLVYLKFWIDLD